MDLTRLFFSLRVWLMSAYGYNNGINMTLVQDKKIRDKKMTVWICILTIYKYRNISFMCMILGMQSQSWLLRQHLCLHTPSGTIGCIAKSY